MTVLNSLGRVPERSLMFVNRRSGIMQQGPVRRAGWVIARGATTPKGRSADTKGLIKKPKFAIVL